MMKNERSAFAVSIVDGRASEHLLAHLLIIALARPEENTALLLLVQLPAQHNRST
jgi:hypothetical protein